MEQIIFWFLLLYIGLQSSSERGSSWAKELGIRPSYGGGLLRYQAVVFFSSRNQQVFKIKRRRRSLNRKCEKMGIRRMTWSQHACIPYRVGLGFQVALVRSLVCDSLQERLVKQIEWGKNGIGILFLKKS